MCQYKTDRFYNSIFFTAIFYFIKNIPRIRLLQQFYAGKQFVELKLVFFLLPIIISINEDLNYFSRNSGDFISLFHC